MEIFKEIDKSSLLVKVLSVAVIVLGSFTLIQLFIYGSEPDSTVTNSVNVAFLEINDHEIPKDLNFAGEAVPINQYDVKEAFERELLVNAYWHSQTLLFIKRTSRFFPVIEPILKFEGVPDDFKYQALIESSFLERSESPAGAVGIWQFLKETGKMYRLEITTEVDERYHLEKATKAACTYLKDAKARLGSWTMAAAAYNAGMAGVQKQVDKQKETNYYHLLFGDETGRYLYRILAAKEILSNPLKYGFKVAEDDLYKPIEFTTLVVEESIVDIADFAKQNGTTYKEVKNLNPWLRETRLTVMPGKTYTLKMPIPSE